MTTLYHVTKTTNVSKIKKRGIATMQSTNWVKAGSGASYGNIGGAALRGDEPYRPAVARSNLTGPSSPLTASPWENLSFHRA